MLSARHCSMPMGAGTKNDLPQGKRQISRKKEERENKVQFRTAMKKILSQESDSEMPREVW